jgi:branched-chain amino acid transport system ATP-binding protein
MLEIRDIELSFAGIKALDGVSASVGEGELVAVIGPNGAGKTSFFNCISGLYKPQKGQILLEGADLLPQAAHRRASLGVARMFQNIALYEHLTVLENMLIGRHHLYRSPWWSDLLRLPSYKAEEIAHRRKVEEIIDFLDLEAHRNMYCGVLPYGVLKRVELGRALCMEPKVLLLDEPAAGLNQEETEDMARYILDIKEELGIAQILIEHHLHLVLDLADKIVVLDFGRCIATGTPEQIQKDPAVMTAYMGAGGEND